MSPVKSGKFIHMIVIPAHDMQKIKQNFKLFLLLQTCWFPVWFSEVQEIATATASNESDTRQDPPGCNPQMTQCSASYRHCQPNGLFHIITHLSTVGSQQTNYFRVWSPLLTSKHVLCVSPSFSGVELLSKMKTSALTQWFDAGSWAVITQKWDVLKFILPIYLLAQAC